MDRLLSAILKDLLLRSVMQKLIKFECPLLLLVVDDAGAAVFGHGQGHRLNNIFIVSKQQSAKD